MTATTLAELVANPYAAKSYIVILKPYDLDAASETTIYLSDRGYVSGPAESPANTYFAPRVMEALNFQRAMFQAGRIGGQSLPGFGSIILANADGDLDDFAGYAWDGRDVEVKIGEQGANLSNHFTIFKGKAKAIEFDDLTVNVVINDNQELFTKTFPTSVYGGTGGTDGSSIMAGQPKPICLGEVFNISPVLVDASNNIYQVHDGQIESIVAVYENGESISGYTADLTNGRFTLSTAPAGIITCDVKGAKPSGSYKETAGDIIRFVAAEYGGLTDPGDFDTASFTALNTANGSTTGAYFQSFTSILQVLDEFANTVGAFYGFDRSGKFNVGQLVVPTGSADLELDTTNIIQLQRQPTAIPNFRVNVKYKKNYTVLDEDSLGASPADRDFMVREGAVETATTAGVQTAYPNSEVLEIDSRFVGSSPASTEATRLAALYGTQRNIYRVRVKTQPYTLKLNDLVEITFPRYDLSSGKLFRVISLFEDAAINEVELELWG